jgi:hypothetical protein
MILGISCLLIGLVAIVILQILKSNYIEGFVYNNGAGCKENKCKLTKSKISEADYKEWCDQCDNCLWDDVAKDCNPNPDYVEPEESDTPNDPCSKPCTQITGERACNGCPSCISCVDRTSGNTCIDRKDYTAEMCPDTDPTDGASTAPPGSNIGSDDTSDYEPSDSKKNKQDESSQKTRANKIHKRDEGTISDAIDYSITESEEAAVAKEKNRQAKFLQDFQSIVHNELLNEQGMTTANSQPYLKEKKDRLSANSKPNQTKGCPDMSEYVRKDSIPCWGCNLD